jgi:hypothetical protein
MLVTPKNDGGTFCADCAFAAWQGKITDNRKREASVNTFRMSHSSKENDFRAEQTLNRSTGCTTVQNQSLQAATFLYCSQGCLTNEAEVNMEG